MHVHNRLAAVAIIALLALSFLASPLLVPARASAAEAPLVFIDPGHGGPLSNANANGLKEKNVNLAIGLALRDVLQARGYRVIMSRDTNRAVSTGNRPTWNYNERADIWRYATDGRYDLRAYPPKDDLVARVDAANAAGADLYISIHNNGAKRRSVRGTETYASKRDIFGRRLSSLVQPRAARGGGLRNNGARLSDFYVCRWSNMPAILVEGGYISNAGDARRLKSARVRLGIATGIADGVDQWFAQNPLVPMYPRVTADDAESLSLAISRADFPGTAPAAVVIRSGEAESLPGAAVLAARLGGPLLFATDGAPSKQTAEEIARLHPARLVMAGTDVAFDTSATASVLASSGVETSTVERIADNDPERLSATIAELCGPSPMGTVAIVAPGDARALAAVNAVAARSGMNVLVEGSSGGAAAEYVAKHRAEISRVLLVGNAALPASPDPGIYTQVMYSADADQLALMLNEFATTMSGPPGTMRPIVVNPLSAPDVLVAATHGARLGQPVIPAIGNVMSPYTREFITNRRPLICGYELIGQNAVLGTPALDRVLDKVTYR